MSNSKSPTISLELDVPTYLPLSEATYANSDELKLCLDITRCIRSKETTAGEYIQVEI